MTKKRKPVVVTHKGESLYFPSIKAADLALGYTSGYLSNLATKYQTVEGLNVDYVK